MECISNMKVNLEKNNLHEIFEIEMRCLKLLSEKVQLWNGVRDKIREDKFAQCILTDDMKKRIITSENQMVIAGRYVFSVIP